MFRLRSTLLGDTSPSIPSTPAQATTWYTLSNVYLQQGLHRRDRKTPGWSFQRALTFNTTKQHRSSWRSTFFITRTRSTDMLVSVIHAGFRDTQNRRFFEARMIFKHKTLHPGGLNTDFAFLWTPKICSFWMCIRAHSFPSQLAQIISNFKFWFWSERYITRTVFGCFLSTDEEAAASKRMEF